jgi:hypothetical protein
MVGVVFVSVRHWFPLEVDAVVPVPLHDFRRRRRLT